MNTSISYTMPALPYPLFLLPSALTALFLPLSLAFGLGCSLSFFLSAGQAQAEDREMRCIIIYSPEEQNFCIFEHEQNCPRYGSSSISKLLVLSHAHVGYRKLCYVVSLEISQMQSDMQLFSVARTFQQSSHMNKASTFLKNMRRKSVGSRCEEASAAVSFGCAYLPPEQPHEQSNKFLKKYATEIRRLGRSKCSENNCLPASSR